MYYRLRDIQAVRVTHERIKNFDFPDWAKPYLKYEQHIFVSEGEDIVIYKVSFVAGDKRHSYEETLIDNTYLIQDDSKINKLRTMEAIDFENMYERIEDE